MISEVSVDGHLGLFEHVNDTTFWKTRAKEDCLPHYGHERNRKKNIWTDRNLNDLIFF